MFIEIHSYYQNNIPPYEWKQHPPRVLNLNIIRTLSETSSDEKIGKMFRISISDDYLQDIIIAQDEAEMIKKKLLSNASGTNGLESSLSELTLAIRDLWNLLRARMR